MFKNLGLVVAAGLLFSVAGRADAQVAVSIGNPFVGRGVYVGAPGYAYPAPPVVGGVYVGVPAVAPAYVAPSIGVGVYGYPRYPAYRPYYGPRYYHGGPYRRW